MHRTARSAAYKIEMENEPYETRSVAARRPFFVLESLSFKNLNNSRNLINCSLNRSDCFDNSEVDISTDTTIKIENQLFSVNENNQNDEEISSITPYNTVATSRPQFVLESLAFTAINKENSYSREAKVTKNVCDRILNKTAVIPSKNISGSCEGSNKKCPRNVPKGKLFYVLESLTYNDSGVQKIISKNVSGETSYEILRIKNIVVSKQTSQSNGVMPRNISGSPTNVSDVKCGKRQIRKGPYLTPSNKSNNSHRLNVSRMVKRKDRLLFSCEQDDINKYLFLEDDPIRFEILKTVRQPRVLLERLPEQFS